MKYEDKTTLLWHLLLNNSFFNDIYVFIFRQKGREGEREGEKHQCAVVLHAHYWGPGLQHRHVPWLGIKPVILWFTGRHSIHWATPARAYFLTTLEYSIYLLNYLYLLLSSNLKTLHFTKGDFRPVRCVTIIHNQTYIWIQ